MPLYEYQCQACGERFELIRKFSDPPLEQCAKCGSGPIDRLVSSPAFQFKGSGFYATDYAQKGKQGAGGTTGKSESKQQDAAPAPPTAKSDAKSETASTPGSSSTTKESSSTTKE